MKQSNLNRVLYEIEIASYLAMTKTLTRFTTFRIIVLHKVKCIEEQQIDIRTGKFVETAYSI